MSTARDNAMAVADRLDSDFERFEGLTGEEFEAAKLKALKRYSAARRGLTAQERGILDGELMSRSLDNVLDTLNGLATRVVELQRDAEGALRYRGIWSAAVDDYRRGHLATHKGALWHCNKSGTEDRPGTSEAWTLMHKSDS